MECDAPLRGLDVPQGLMAEVPDTNHNILFSTSMNPSAHPGMQQPRKEALKSDKADSRHGVPWALGADIPLVTATAYLTRIGVGFHSPLARRSGPS
jgi:hypothetical protein